MASSILLKDSSPERESLVFERFLRDGDGIWRQISSQYQLDQLLRQMMTHTAIALAMYGAVMGIGHSLTQALVSAIKLPLLFLLTLVICLPTLYLFNLLCGGRLSVRQAFALVLAAIMVTATLLLPFAPITLFFLITAPNYSFFLLLNVALLTLTGMIGLGFLVRGTQRLNALAAEPDTSYVQSSDTASRKSVSLSLLSVWMLLYGLVGTQLGWTLRPFFGDPNLPFQLFRSIRGNFYIGVFNALIELLFH
jgi:hypothetical protein